MCCYWFFLLRFFRRREEFENFVLGQRNNYIFINVCVQVCVCVCLRVGVKLSIHGREKFWNCNILLEAYLNNSCKILQAHISMSFVVYFRVWIFSSVFAGGFFGSGVVLRIPPRAGLAKVLSLIVVPFFVPNFIQIFPSAVRARRCSNREKKCRFAQFLIGTDRREGTDRNETKTGHLYKLIISLLKKEKAQPQTEGCLKNTPVCITSCTIYVVFV